ncbi:MAG: F0F1 ATP synthase subunit B [Candidatus Kerfeldbacteria bacterium]|jgi:F-type H+-transporting ATPase subunit b
MDELVKTFHIDWKLLIAQIINFAIVLGVLWFFAIKPLMKVMNKRSDDIEKSLKDAEEIEKKLKEAGDTKEKIVIEAKKEAQIIMETVHKESDHTRDEKLKQTREEVEKIVAKTKADLEDEKEKIIKEAKQEVADLVVIASSKIIGKEIDKESNKKLIEDTINQVN